MTHVAVLLAAVILMVIPLVKPSKAADTYETMLQGEGTPASGSVLFFASCGDECYAASLDCDNRGSILFTFADIDAEIAAAAITREERDFAISINGKPHSFSIMKLDFGGDMNGTWQVSGTLPDSAAPEFADALSRVKNFQAVIGKENLTLPVTADVKTWAEACVKRSRAAQ